LGVRWSTAIANVSAMVDVSMRTMVRIMRVSICMKHIVTGMMRLSMRSLWSDCVWHHCGLQTIVVIGTSAAVAAAAKASTRATAAAAASRTAFAIASEAILPFVGGSQETLLGTCTAFARRTRSHEQEGLLHLWPVSGVPLWAAASVRFDGTAMRI